jgi:hypothetical protein
LSHHFLSLIVLYTSYEATSSTRSRSLAKEITTAAVASVFLVSLLKHRLFRHSKTPNVEPELVDILTEFASQGFGSLFVLLASGVYV